MAEPTITNAQVTVEWGRATVRGTLTSGEEYTGPSWYVDELSLTAAQFEGLTPTQAAELHFRTDVAYLQS